MRLPTFPRVLSLGIISLIATPVALAAPPVLVWNIGTIDNNTKEEPEFEHENQGDEYFYLHPGNYGHVYGWDTISNTYSLPGGIALDPEPLSDPTDPTIGFERAVVGGGNEDAINIFFQLQPSHLIPGAKYRFDAAFSGLGGHDIILGFNGIEFPAPYSVANNDGYRGYSQVFTAEEVGAMIGGNVLTLRTDNPNSGTYAVLDYLRLTLLSPNVIFALGADDNSQADFETEGSGNDAKFYVHAGDYSQVNGKSGAGMFVGAPERLRDGVAGSTEGFPRALTASRPQLDLFFQLTPEEAAAEMLRFEADLFSLAGGSTHDLRFSINGVTLGEIFGVTSAQLATFDFLTSLVNPGENVLSIERIGGSGPNGEFIQFDYLQLSTIPEPSSAALIGLGAIGLGMIRRRRA